MQKMFLSVRVLPAVVLWHFTVKCWWFRRATCLNRSWRFLAWSTQQNNSKSVKLTFQAADFSVENAEVKLPVQSKHRLSTSSKSNRRPKIKPSIIYSKVKNDQKAPEKALKNPETSRNYSKLYLFFPSQLLTIFESFLSSFSSACKKMYLAAAHLAMSWEASNRSTNCIMTERLGFDASRSLEKIMKNCTSLPKGRLIVPKFRKTILKKSKPLPFNKELCRVKKGVPKKKHYW